MKYYQRTKAYFKSFLQPFKGRPQSKPPSANKSALSLAKHTIQLAVYDKIIYIIKSDQNYKTQEVVSVTYVTKIGNNWEMVVYFDDVHGLLHRHRRINIENNIDSLDFPRGDNSSNHEVNLRHAINYISKNYYFYRRHLLKASKAYIKNNNLDTYYD